MDGSWCGALEESQHPRGGADRVLRTAVVAGMILVMAAACADDDGEGDTDALGAIDEAEAAEVDADELDDASADDASADDAQAADDESVEPDEEGTDEAVADPAEVAETSDDGEESGTEFDALPEGQQALAEQVCSSVRDWYEYLELDGDTPPGGDERALTGNLLMAGEAGPFLEPYGEALVNLDADPDGPQPMEVGPDGLRLYELMLMRCVEAGVTF